MDMRYLEFMSHLSNIRQMRYTSFVIGNFFKKALVTKVSCPKLLVTLKMMDVRQNVNVISTCTAVTLSDQGLAHST